TAARGTNPTPSPLATACFRLSRPGITTNTPEGGAALSVDLDVTTAGSGRPASVTSRSEWRTDAGSSRHEANGWLVGSRAQKPPDRTGTGTEHNGAGTPSLVVTPMSMVPVPTSERIST